jgi:hypothetical protein
LEVKKIDPHSRFVCILILIVFLGFNCCFYGEIAVSAQTNQFISELQTANKALGQAFNSVLEAEKVGGNVTELMIKLNTAGDLLAEAQNALNNGSMANLTSDLENVRQISNQVNYDALNLKNVSLVKSQNSLWLTLSFSAIGAVVFGVSLLIVWRRFKRTFITKLLGSKPEVTENAP